jgi:hypothetical protein
MEGKAVVSQSTFIKLIGRCAFLVALQNWFPILDDS